MPEMLWSFFFLLNNFQKNKGRLRFNIEDGTYLCPGYVDGGDNCVKGDDYIFCFQKYTFKEI